MYVGGVEGGVAFREQWEGVGLQCGVDVDEDDDDKVQDGPNDSQHCQNGLLLALLVLDSLFFITDDSVYHFPRKSLQLSSQTNLLKTTSNK